MVREGQSIIKQLSKTNRRLSKGHRKIADFIEAHYDKVVFMTAARLGELAQISESTVVRFAIACGYEGYPQMQKALKEIVRHRLTSAQRLGMAGNLEPDSMPQELLKMDMNNIRATIEDLDVALFQKVVQEISKAKRIYLLGMRSAAPLADFFGYYLHYIFEDVRVLSSAVNDTFESIARIQPGDVLIAVSFPRYSNRTLESMRFARSQGATVIGITDGSLSPLHDVSDLCLDARTDIASFADSLAAPLSLINALIAALGEMNREKVRQNFLELEQVWDTYRVYAGRE